MYLILPILKFSYICFTVIQLNDDLVRLTGVCTMKVAPFSHHAHKKSVYHCVIIKKNFFIFLCSLNGKKITTKLCSIERITKKKENKK